MTTLLALIDGGEIAVALQVEGVGDRGIATELKAAARALLGVQLPGPSPTDSRE